jgi:uncharacterized protein with von Willebrand factor type A (vWA) domain
MEKKIVEFTNLLRKAGVRVSVAESLDAFNAIDEMPLEDRELFKDALRTTMVKRGDDIDTYDRLFDLFWSGFYDQLQNELKQALGACPATSTSSAARAARDCSRTWTSTCPSSQGPAQHGRERARAADPAGGRGVRGRQHPQHAADRLLLARMLEQMDMEGRGELDPDGPPAREGMTRNASPSWRALKAVKRRRAGRSASSRSASSTSRTTTTSSASGARACSRRASTT